MRKWRKTNDRWFGRPSLDNTPSHLEIIKRRGGTPVASCCYYLLSQSWTNTRTIHIRFFFSHLTFFSFFPSLFLSLPPTIAARDRRVRGASCTRSSNATGSYDEIALRAICRSERYNAYPTSPRGESAGRTHALFDAHAWFRWTILREPLRHDWWIISHGGRAWIVKSEG